MVERPVALVSFQLRPALDSIPVELVHMVCSYLGPAATLLMMRVCRRFYCLLNDQIGLPLWKEFASCIPGDQDQELPTIHVCTMHGGHVAYGPRREHRAVSDPRRRVLCYLASVANVLSASCWATVSGTTFAFREGDKKLRMLFHKLGRAGQERITCSYIKFGHVLLGTWDMENPTDRQELRIGLKMASLMFQNAYRRTADGYAGRNSHQRMPTDTDLLPKDSPRYRAMADSCSLVLAKLDSNLLLRRTSLCIGKVVSPFCCDGHFPCLQDEPPP